MFQFHCPGGDIFLVQTTIRCCHDIRKSSRTIRVSVNGHPNPILIGTPAIAWWFTHSFYPVHGRLLRPEIAHVASIFAWLSRWMSLFSRRKYDMGRMWVLRSVKVGAPGRRGFLVRVGKQDEETLPRVLQQHDLHWSTMVSDWWRVSTTVALLGYQHLTVNHTINFVDPNTDACTSHINIYWTTNVKKRSKRHWGLANPMQPLLKQVWGISVSLEASPLPWRESAFVMTSDRYRKSTRED